jgi:hypothetical protein
MATQLLLFPYVNKRSMLDLILYKQRIEEIINFLKSSVMLVCASQYAILLKKSASSRQIGYLMYDKNAFQRISTNQTHIHTEGHLIQ